ncbi:MAG: HAD-IB family phosphatase, partial [Sporichthyaceae bacterium]|nr:HAD-IB family phosphatase [Sporichthyaceae bacterium]
QQDDPHTLTKDNRGMSPHRDSRPPDRGGTEIAFLVDYDGTIATIDISDELVRVASSTEQWLALDLAYRRGEIGSRALLEAEAQLLPRSAAELPDLAQEHDPAFLPFVRYAQGHGILVEVVSDGLGFFVGPAIAALGLPEVPVFAAALEFGPHGPAIMFPNGHPTCRLCGTCKRERILHNQQAGRHVVFVGDGYSDRYAVCHADTVFAKGDLATICDGLGRRYQKWTTFTDVQAWLSDALAGGGLPGPVSRPFVCGPELDGTAGDE